MLGVAQDNDRVLLLFFIGVCFIPSFDFIHFCARAFSSSAPFPLSLGPCHSSFPEIDAWPVLRHVARAGTFKNCWWKIFSSRAKPEAMERLQAPEAAPLTLTIIFRFSIVPFLTYLHLRRLEVAPPKLPSL